MTVVTYVTFEIHRTLLLYCLRLIVENCEGVAQTLSNCEPKIALNLFSTISVW